MARLRRKRRSLSMAIEESPADRGDRQSVQIFPVPARPDRGAGHGHTERFLGLRAASRAPTRGARERPARRPADATGAAPNDRSRAAGATRGNLRGRHLWRHLRERDLAGGASPAACGLPGIESPPPTVPDRSDADKVVNWSSWPEYIDVDPNDGTSTHDRGASPPRPGSRSTTQRTSTTTTSTSPRSSRSSPPAGPSPLMCSWSPTGWSDKLIRLGYLQELDHSQDPELQESPYRPDKVSFDPGRKRSITWQSGLTGIAYNPKATDGKTWRPHRPTAHRLFAEGQGHVAHRDAGHRRVDHAGHGRRPGEVHRGPVRRGHRQTAEVGGFRADPAVHRQRLRPGSGAGHIAACMAWTGDVVQLQPDNPDLECSSAGRAACSGATTSSSRS